MVKKGGKMVVKSKENLIGAWAFLIGVILAIVIGLLAAFDIGDYPILLGILVILGIIVGFLNISSKDMNTFLLVAVSLVIVSFAGLSGITSAALFGLEVGAIVTKILGGFLALFVPAAIIVALKAGFAIAKK